MIEQLKQLGTPRFFHKGSFLFRQGERAGNLFIIQQGLVKAYYETRDGREFIKSFVREDEFIGSMQAIVANNPNPFTVISIEDCRALEISKTALLDLVAREPKATEALNSLLLKLAMKKERREYELLCLSAEERYLLFCNRESALLTRLSQNDIARYLGITPVALSRIRKRCRSKLTASVDAVN
jgi:CRP-like cAMP-binding protein